MTEAQEQVERTATKARWSGRVLVGAVALAIAAGAYAIVQEEGTKEKLGGVQQAGPCRAAVEIARDAGETTAEAIEAAIYDKECARQSDLVTWSYCVRHKIVWCPGVPSFIRPERVSGKGPNQAVPPPERSRSPDTASGIEGGGSQQPPAAVQRPGPSQGGSPGGGNGGGGGNPSTNPPPAESPGALNPITDPLGIDCHINVLGIKVCN